MQRDLTRGSVARSLILFSLPLMAGNLLQQLYNLADTWVVGRFLGQTALAAVGSAFTLMTLLTSILLGLCMGAGVVVSHFYGEGDHAMMRRTVGNAFVLISAVTALLTLLSYLLLEPLMDLLRVPDEARSALRAYLQVIFAGIPATFLYNYVASVMRSAGNSVTPLWFLAASALLNIALDLVMVPLMHWGVPGAALATVIAQWLSALGIGGYFLLRCPALTPSRQHFRPDGALMRRVASVSALTSIQQSVMNFGILMIQSLVNSFGVPVMAAFAAGVKIDAFAYSPAQDFAGGFATFVAQNRGAGRNDRVRKGFLTATALSLSLCAVVSLLVAIFAKPLLCLFIDPGAEEVLRIGMGYLRSEGLCYVGIGMLFLLYATWRGLEKAGMSVVLTVISLGLRVALAYTFAPSLGLYAIWWSIPIGWLIADIVGLTGLRRHLTPHTGSSRTPD